MHRLSPTEAAGIANGVYNARTQMLWQQAKRSNLLGIREIFALSGDAFDGKSGGNFITSRTGFGYIAKGVGVRQGEALVALRGTEMGHVFDVFTDLRFGMQVGPSGALVHAGFNDTFKSCVRAIDKGVRALDPGHVHIVGHSLGGALATLTADHLRNCGQSVTLYTFGCPRVGCQSFADDFVSKMGADAIYRARHLGDPVAMVPLFPYLHVPMQGPEFPLQWPGSVSFPSHKMANYVASVRDKTWESIRALQETKLALQQGVRRMLESPPSGGLGMFSASLLNMITQALGWLVRAEGQASGVILTAGATVLDHLAAMLYRRSLFCPETREHVKGLMRMIFRFLGRSITTAIDVNAAFIRWVLGMLYSRVNIAARRSLEIAGEL